MINSKTERKAIYSVAKLFTEFEWFFTEPNYDFGIDAFVETSEDKRPNGKLIGLQIKGGEKNFQRSNQSLTFYFSETHCEFWLNAKYPVLIVLQDSKGIVYWREISLSNIRKTQKRWKIEIPLKNELGINSKAEIESLINLFYNGEPNIIILEKPPTEKNSLLSFSMNFSHDKKLGSLKCRISYDRKFKEINLGYRPSTNHWDKLKSELTWNDPYYYILHSLRKYLKNKFFNSNDQLEILKE